MSSYWSGKEVCDVEHRAKVEDHYKKSEARLGYTLTFGGGSRTADAKAHGKELQVAVDHLDEEVGHHTAHLANRPGRSRLEVLLGLKG